MTLERKQSGSAQTNKQKKEDKTQGSKMYKKRENVTYININIEASD